jgi:lipoate-protein ligase A
VGDGSKGDRGGCRQEANTIEIASPTTASVPCANREPFLCFQRRAPGDVLVRGEKIAGSAQRRCRGAVLQHGSVLLARSVAAPELAGVKELTGRPILVEEFIKTWLERLSQKLAITPRRSNLAEEHRRRASRLVIEKYASPTWTNAR